MLTAWLVLGVVPALAAQELEPRSYSASPVGTSFFVMGWASSSGNVVTDPSVPLKDVHASVETVAPAYGHSFNMFGAQALFTVSLPYSWAWVSGKVGGSPTDSAITRIGVGDMKAKFSVNFIGSPALTPAEFAKRVRPNWIAGASIAIVAPTGEYLPYHLLNVGLNRWAFKPEVGVSYTSKGKLYVDLYTGVWLYAPNAAYYPGASRQTQDPLWSVQLHASYNFTPRIFAALESTWYSGGSVVIDDGAPSTRQDNSRVGALFAYGFTDRQSVKISFSTGASARVGQKFDTVGLAYQLMWF